MTPEQVSREIRNAGLHERSVGSCNAGTVHIVYGERYTDGCAAVSYLHRESDDETLIRGRITRAVIVLRENCDAR